MLFRKKTLTIKGKVYPIYDSIVIRKDRLNICFEICWIYEVRVYSDEKLSHDKMYLTYKIIYV